MRPIKLKPRERIVAVVPERCSGPGWSNSLVWVYIEGPSGIRTDCLQPEEQSGALILLHAAGAEMARALISAVPCASEFEGQYTDSCPGINIASAIRAMKGNQT